MPPDRVARLSARSDVVETGSWVMRERRRVVFCDGDDATWCCETAAKLLQPPISEAEAEKGRDTELRGFD